MSPSYWKRRKARRLERSRKGVEARERKRLDSLAVAGAEAVREWKMVRRITDEAVYRTRRVIEFWVLDCGEGKIRMEVWENGERVKGIRTFAGTMRAMGKTV